MLIHKTMTMPTSCLSCWISPTCDVWVREKSKHKGYDNRLVNCPLEEVKHGHWISCDDDGDSPYKCSVCGGVKVNKSGEWLDICHQEWSKMPYCAVCGAKMDGVET